MTADFRPIDQPARDRIVNRIEETLFVEAGAGTGKTTALVGRIVSLVKNGHDISKIAAITFTEAAAAELRDRVRREMEKEAAKPGNEFFLSAVRDMDKASIQTLHSFAGSLLREKPLEAGLPPGFEVVEEIESEIDFEEKWQKWLDEAMNSDQVSAALVKSVRLGLSLDKLKGVARIFDYNYHLLPAKFSGETEDSLAYVKQFIDVISSIEPLLTCAHNAEDDPLFNHCRRLLETSRRMQLAGIQNEVALITLSHTGKISFTAGKQADWDAIPGTKTNACKAIKETLGALSDTVTGGFEKTRRMALIPLLENLRQFADSYARERRLAGKASFQDLLVWARDLLKTDHNTRRHFQQKFSHILIDEFQDTDPIQAEIAFYLAEDAGTSGKCETDWTNVRLTPGKLFVVGDPKQSIYRFRRADIVTVEEVKSLIAGQDGQGDTVPLSQNFRSQKPIINWVNAVFEVCMLPNAEGTQSCYIPLDARWDDLRTAPPLGVHHLGGAVEGKMAEIRLRQANEIASTITMIRACSWQVREERSNELRPVKHRDICILMPTRTGLQTLERALDSARIPYRVESQSMILGTQDVRELISCLRAIDSPSDQIALVAALRSSAFAISDVELLQFVEGGGNLDYTNPGTGDGPVKSALESLAKFHQSYIWLSPAQVIEMFVREQQMEEMCFGRARPRERLRRLQFVIEKARSFSEVRESSLRGFLDWIEKLAAENSRMVEVPVPESDEDAVRIMTIHAAKGLEFPITILLGLASSNGNQSDPVIFDTRKKSTEVSVGGSTGPKFSTSGYEVANNCEKLACAAEYIRLMYVAATRAKDHLIISLYRPLKKNDDTFAGKIEAICKGTGGIWNPVDLSQVNHEGEISEPINHAEKKFDTAEDRQQWIEKRKNLLHAAAQPASVAVTTLTSINKEEPSEEFPYRLGRGGTSLGRAVHSVLQTINLASGKDLVGTAQAQADNEGIPEKAGEVAKLVSNALDSSVVKRAVASQRYYREVFVSFPSQETAIDGFVDLLFKEDGGLVIVDYKTDAIDEDPSENKKEQYGLQAGIYALAVSRIIGKPVKEVVLLFLSKPKELVFTEVSALMIKAEEAIKRVLSTRS